MKVQIATELAKPRTKEEFEAEKVLAAQINRYWRARETERLAARVHQEDLSIEEKILRLFDMSSQFGVRTSFSNSVCGVMWLIVHLALYWNR